MRTLALIALQAALAASVAGCASTGGGTGLASERERLQNDCRARGGILVPSGANTGRPQLDEVCRIN